MSTDGLLEALSQKDIIILEKNKIISEQEDLISKLKKQIAEIKKAIGANTESISFELSRWIHKRDKETCQKCGSKKFETLTIDHAKPKFLGGLNEKGNLQLLCKSCNQEKGLTIRSYKTSKICDSPYDYFGQCLNELFECRTNSYIPQEIVFERIFDWYDLQDQVYTSQDKITKEYIKERLIEKGVKEDYRTYKSTGLDKLCFINLRGI